MIGRVDGYLTLHTYAQMWIHPFSHETQYYPEDIEKLVKKKFKKKNSIKKFQKILAEKATEKLRQVYGTKYIVGTGADLLCN